RVNLSNADPRHGERAHRWKVADAVARSSARPVERRQSGGAVLARRPLPSDHAIPATAVAASPGRSRSPGPDPRSPPRAELESVRARPDRQQLRAPGPWARRRRPCRRAARRTACRPLVRSVGAALGRLRAEPPDRLRADEQYAATRRAGLPAGGARGV